MPAGVIPAVIPVLIPAAIPVLIPAAIPAVIPALIPAVTAPKITYGVTLFIPNSGCLTSFTRLN
jgi:hypothetical protein